MKTITRFLIGTAGVFILVVVISILMPTTYNTAHGKIVKVYEGGVKDAVFELADSERSFYLNRAYQGYGEVAMNRLVGRDVQISYAEKWTPLDPFGNGLKSIVELKAGGAVYVRH
jgi:hypothetical protein